MPGFEYRKSSYSDQAAECVEIATNIPTAVAVRDSKNADDPGLRLAPTTWALFKTALVTGTL
ncbi:DUF397 domain-containing protein [Streptomyces sp. NPDC048277]|uniref:DUF397 domain-containing protein n=1 Tax=Streptomyces sp. NPDC048277 TaxID=3155027 RepID=UPI0034042348